MRYVSSPVGADDAGALSLCCQLTEIFNILGQAVATYSVLHRYRSEPKIRFDFDGWKRFLYRRDRYSKPTNMNDYRIGSIRLIV